MHSDFLASSVLVPLPKAPSPPSPRELEGGHAMSLGWRRAVKSRQLVPALHGARQGRTALCLRSALETEIRARLQRPLGVCTCA